MEHQVTLQANEEASIDSLNIPEGVQMRSGNDVFSVDLTSGEYREEEASKTDSLKDDSTDEQVEESVEDEHQQSEEQNDEEHEQEPPELKETTSLSNLKEQLEEGQEGMDALLDSAIKAEKLSQDDVNNFMTEYETNGSLSEKSLLKLEEAGYTRGFIKSFIQGQEALAQQYTNAVYEFAGGKQQFDAYVSHLQDVAPSMVISLQKAMENSDIEMIKGVFEMARHSMVSKFGKPAERTVTKKAVASTAQKVEKGFSSQAEMIKAINDPRYSRDPKYRAEVERKMLIK